mmetsp:Transcript_16815/g.49509  ORF Transcript_16815/g.49509 Transcript_16815/m.49509 type:complete len:251 (-) Transcript_16815:388-1140(-)
MTHGHIYTDRFLCSVWPSIESVDDGLKIGTLHPLHWLLQKLPEDHIVFVSKGRRTAGPGAPVQVLWIHKPVLPMLPNELFEELSDAGFSAPIPHNNNPDILGQNSLHPLGDIPAFIQVEFHGARFAAITALSEKLNHGRAPLICSRTECAMKPIHGGGHIDRHVMHDRIQPDICKGLFQKWIEICCQEQRQLPFLLFLTVEPHIFDDLRKFLQRFCGGLVGAQFAEVRLSFAFLFVKGHNDGFVWGFQIG